MVVMSNSELYLVKFIDFLLDFQESLLYVIRCNSSGISAKHFPHSEIEEGTIMNASERRKLETDGEVISDLFGLEGSANENRLDDTEYFDSESLSNQENNHNPVPNRRAVSDLSDGSADPSNSSTLTDEYVIPKSVFGEEIPLSENALKGLFMRS
jgi:hypothetical protein